MSDPTLEFHVSRQARDRYEFDESLFSLTGNVVFANLHAARVFAQRINDGRDLINFPEQMVRAGQINAMGLIDEILHYVVGLYRQWHAPEIFGQAMEWLSEQVGEPELDTVLHRFAEQFPPVAVYRGEIDLEAYLAGETAGVPHRRLVLEELLLLWLANRNPAFTSFGELFDDTELREETAYERVLESLHGFFDEQPPFGPDHQNLIDMLRAPAIAVPDSLTGQLEYIRQRWGFLLGDFLLRLLTGLDLIKEEEKLIFDGTGLAPVLEFTGLEFEPKRFSPDRDWMPSVVLLAKNVHVWLDQLSKKHEREIRRLDEIPVEELDTLARWGFNGLWLIGLWQRSPASARIKQAMGNPEAVASAYSLFAYEIAEDLGGDEAWQALHDRAWERGLRLASDMVPNHMGIDSRWVIEHPDWFVSLDHSPFPSYSFSGPNLSWDGRVGIYLEDHYYNHSDAAVVFKRVDFWSGQETFIYHGNDGTSMPWNDTAQLDYLKPEVREALIQTILHVARKFPVIRFDAAMTLAKRHYHRLWYPEPGSGGDIPSRAEHGLTKHDFDAAMPAEFWREVVDRVAQELPDTLLLAEAFWLMEGYFVRTLGMHRVYNSAFMNMLRDERNQEYRLVMKRTIEFDPEILKRYVHFMNNPDERTAVDQFGKEDKYFGVCTMMATLPGLPMFGHGQIEGFHEKYGMEYRRAYWEEEPDRTLVERHERQVFPLLRRRYLFAEASDFRLYDFFTPDGHVNEDVFSYSNRAGDERALVIYHNRYASTQGWIRMSAAYPTNTEPEGDPNLVQTSLAESLGLHDDAGYYTIFRDQIAGLEYIHSSRELWESGLEVHLDAYRCHVFLDFREVEDRDGNRYGRLLQHLGGRGVPSLDEALKEMVLQCIHDPFRELANAGQFRWLITRRRAPGSPAANETQSALEEVEVKARRLLAQIKAFVGGHGDDAAVASRVRRDVQALLRGTVFEALAACGETTLAGEAQQFLKSGPRPTDGDPWSDGEPGVWGTLLGWTIVRHLGNMQDASAAGGMSRAWIDEWLLGKFLARTLQDLGLESDDAWRAVGAIKLLTGHQGWDETRGDDEGSRPERAAHRLLQRWMRDAEVQRFLGVNRYEGVLWFNREAFREWLWWLTAAAALRATSESEDPTAAGDRIVRAYEVVVLLQQAQERSQCQVQRLLKESKSQAENPLSI